MKRCSGMVVLDKIRKWREKRNIQKWNKIKNWVEFGVSEKPKPECFGNHGGMDKDFDKKPEDKNKCNALNCRLCFDCLRATTERMIKEGKTKGYIIRHGPNRSEKIESK
jgi:hypothetical protein